MRTQCPLCEGPLGASWLEQCAACEARMRYDQQRGLAKGLIGLSIPIVLYGGYAHIQELAALAVALLAVALWALWSA